MCALTQMLNEEARLKEEIGGQSGGTTTVKRCTVTSCSLVSWPAWLIVKEKIGGLLAGELVIWPAISVGFI